MINVTLKPSGVTFIVESNETILQAALRQKINLPHGCKTGQCDLCTAIYNREQEIKTCLHKPKKDIELVVNLLPELDDIEIKTLPCRITSLDYVNSDVVIVKLRLPPTQSFQYLSGQYIDLIMGSNRRSYSIASIPDESLIELHIRKVENGLFSNYFFNESKVNDLLRLEGPFGTFFRSDASTLAKRPMIFLASGTGFSAIASIIKSIISNNDFPHIWIYWGNRTRSGFYTSLPKTWAKNYRDISFIPVISEYTPSSAEFRDGLVHQAILDDFVSLDGYEVYACGNPEMIQAAKTSFGKAKLDPSLFFSDAFFPFK